MESIAIYIPIILSLIGLIYMLIKKAWVMKQDAGDGKMKEISDHIFLRLIWIQQRAIFAAFPGKHNKTKTKTVCA